MQPGKLYAKSSKAEDNDMIKKRLRLLPQSFLINNNVQSPEVSSSL